MKTQYIVIIGLMFLWQGLHSQTAREDLAKIQAASQNIASLSMELDYALYKGHQSKTLAERSKGKYYCQGKKYHLDFYGTINIQDGQYLLSLDKESKMAVLSNAQNITQLAASPSIESFLNSKHRVEQLGANGYRILMPPSRMMEYDSIDLYFDRQSYMVTQLIFYYHHALDFDDDIRQEDLAKPRLEIRYQNINTKAILRKELFALSKYIHLKASPKRMTAAYQDYQLIDQSH